MNLNFSSFLRFQLTINKSIFTFNILPICGGILSTWCIVFPRTLDVDQWWQTLPDAESGNNTGYRLISILNVLDRCAKPFSLLKTAREAIQYPGGLLLVGLVLPYSPFVEETAAEDKHNPKEWLQIQGETFEDQVHSIIHVSHFSDLYIKRM